MGAGVATTVLDSSAGWPPGAGEADGDGDDDGSGTAAVGGDGEGEGEEAAGDEAAQTMSTFATRFVNSPPRVWACTVSVWPIGSAVKLYHETE